MQTREEHLQWCKARALAYVDAGEPLQEALTSMMSDLKKHPETENHIGIPLTLGLMIAGALRTPDAVRWHIEGFR